MHIEMTVPYDEKKLRRTLRSIVRRRMTRMFVLGAIIAAIGVLQAILVPAAFVAYLMMLFGASTIVSVPVRAVRLLRLQSELRRQDCHVTLDDERITATYPELETRIWWHALDQVEETREFWNLTFAKVHTAVVWKNLMTDEQRAEFSAFLATAPATTSAPVG